MRSTDPMSARDEPDAGAHRPTQSGVVPLRRGRSCVRALALALLAAAIASAPVAAQQPARLPIRESHVSLRHVGDAYARMRLMIVRPKRSSALVVALALASLSRSAGAAPALEPQHPHFQDAKGQLAA